MRFLVFGDIVENKKALIKLSKMDFKGYDFVLFTGDTLTLLPFKKLREKRVLAGEISENEEERKRHLRDTVQDDKRVLQKEVMKLKELVKYFAKINKKIPIYGIWGNADHLWITGQTTLSKYVKNFHLKSIKIDGFSFIGYNGRPKYIFETYENPIERAFDEDKAFKGLSKVFEKTKGKIIFVTHAPPFEILDQVERKYRKYAIGTYGKKAKKGHIGSIAFRRIDNKFKPILHVFGHIHECKGVKKVNETTFVNSGSFGKGLEYAIIEIEDNKLKVNFSK